MEVRALSSTVVPAPRPASQKIKGLPGELWRTIGAFLCPLSDRLDITCKQMKSHLKMNEFQTTLDLSSNSEITDEELGRLVARYPNLTHLNLRGCSRITDQGLSHLAHLTQLQHLDLSRCRGITDQGLQYLASLTQLQHLDLGLCSRITDHGLSHLAPLTQLRYLSLNSCRGITDQGLSHLAHLTQLQHLNLSGCPGVTVQGLPHLAQLTQLQHLNLSGCNMRRGLQHLSPLTQLKCLGLRRCNIYDDDLQDLSSFTQLEQLDISDNSIYGEDLQHLAPFTQLKCLDLSHTSITDDGLRHLASLGQLQDLSLKYCNRITGHGLWCLANFPLLQTLELEGTNIGDLRNLPNLPQLKHLNLDGSQVFIHGLQRFPSFPQLQYLNLRDTNINDGGLQRLVGQYPQLRKLKLRSCSELTDEGLWYLPGLTSLRSLSVSSKSITRQGLQNLKQLMPELELSATVNICEEWVEEKKYPEEKRQHSTLPEEKKVKHPHSQPLRHREPVHTHKEVAPETEVPSVDVQGLERTPEVHAFDEPEFQGCEQVATCLKKNFIPIVFGLSAAAYATAFLPGIFVGTTLYKMQSIVKLMWSSKSTSF